MRRNELEAKLKEQTSQLKLQQVRATDQCLSAFFGRLLGMGRLGASRVMRVFGHFRSRRMSVVVCGFLE